MNALAVTMQLFYADHQEFDVQYAPMVKLSHG